MTYKFVNSGNWIVLDNAMANQSSNSVFIPTEGWMEESQEYLRKSAVMKKLFHIGVVFAHKNSKVLWKVIEVAKDEDTNEILYVWVQSQKSGYKKVIWPTEYSYDNFTLHEAPDAIRILYGDQKHERSAPTQVIDNTSKTPETADTAFAETDLSEIDLSGD